MLWPLVSRRSLAPAKASSLPSCVKQHRGREQKDDAASSRKAQEPGNEEDAIDVGSVEFVASAHEPPWVYPLRDPWVGWADEPPLSRSMAADASAIVSASNGLPPKTSLSSP